MKPSLVLALVGLLVLGVLGGVWLAAAQSPPERRATSPSTTPTAAATPPPASPPAGPPAAATSDSFDGWTVAEGGGATRFLQTDAHHGGTAALLVVRPDGDVPGAEPGIAQNIDVPQDSRVQIEFWASSEGSATVGAVQVRFGGAAGASVSLPAGPYDWTRFTLDWTVPAGVTTGTLAVVAAGPTAGTRIDDVAVIGQGSSGSVVQDAGFETSSAAAFVTNTSLVLRSTDTLGLRSRLAPEGAYSWSMREYTGGDPIRGRGRFADGAATVPLVDVPNGYYTFTLRVPVAGSTVERTTNLVVTPPPMGGVGPTTLGVGVHFGGETDQQLTRKVQDLAALGITAARTDADWASIEREQGRFDFTGLDRVVLALERGGLRPLLILDYRNRYYDQGRTPSTAAGIAAYARFAGAVAQRYPGADFEVYNEFDFRFNNGACGKTPQCYQQLLHPTTAALRSTGNTGTIAGPAIAGIGVQLNWLSGFIGGGGLMDVDALSLHPYVQPARPEVLDADLTTLRDRMAAAGGGTRPIWFTEFGDATVPGLVGERQQAEDVARVFGVAAVHDVTRIYWYDAIDDGTDRSDPEDNFGLFRSPTSFVPSAFVPKPAAAVVATTARESAGGSQATSTGSDPTKRVVSIPRGDSTVRLAWATTAQPSSVRGGGDVVTMTGRSLRGSRSLSLTSSPVWLLDGAALRP